jgi:hypothetical protein
LEKSTEDTEMINS